jgi:hypothetical protein
MLWALGAGIGRAMLRSWPQGAMVAILVPYCLACEWTVAMEDINLSYYESPVAAGVFLFALAYLTGRRSDSDSAFRKTLGWIGGLAFIPAAAFFCFYNSLEPEWQYPAVGWGIAIAGPTTVAFAMRRWGALWNLAGAVWTVIL